MRALPDGAPTTRELCSIAFALPVVALAALEPIAAEAPGLSLSARDCALIALAAIGAWCGAIAELVRAPDASALRTRSLLTRLPADPLSWRHLRVALSRKDRVAVARLRADLMHKRSRKLRAGWWVPAVMATECFEMLVALMRAYGGAIWKALAALGALVVTLHAIAPR